MSDFSTIVTSIPFLLNASAVSRPINPAPTTTAFLILSLFSLMYSFIFTACSACERVNTFSRFSEYPLIFGTKDFAPTAMISLSYSNAPFISLPSTVKVLFLKSIFVTLCSILTLTPLFIKSSGVPRTTSLNDSSSAI